MQQDLLLETSFDHLWNYGKPAETRANFIERSNTDSLKTNGDELAQLYSQVARTYSLQAKVDSGMQWIDKAKALNQDQKNVAAVRILLEEGRLYRTDGNGTKANELFEAAADLGADIGADYYTIDALHMLGMQEDLKTQLKWALKAIKVAECTHQPKAKQWLGALYNNIGWTYHDLGEYNNAENVLQKALEWRIEQGKRRPIQIARYGLAVQKRMLGKTSEALSIQQALLIELQKDEIEDALVYEELAYLEMKDNPAQAKKYAKQAIEIFKADGWTAKNQPQRITDLEALIA